ncbi:MAG TPA: WecB/TagA/CpsF family glycosyltransferase [Terriglobia bacterium]|nr:WecB/TagA/CpsF family glycosyltransferase [Terriglobia bacterium]
MPRQTSVRPPYSRDIPGRAHIAGVDFDLIDAQGVLDRIREWRRTSRCGTVSLVNPHSVLLCRRDREMSQAVRRASLTLPDGIGVILGARMLSHQHCGRVSGPELLLYLCDQGRRYGFTHYFYGGEPGVAERIALNMASRFPGLLLAGWHSPPFRDDHDDEGEAVFAEINARQPAILWLGLGAPKQEKWMARHAHRVSAAATIGVGAAFDFHSGNKRWCPVALRQAGLEWAFRLAHEPKRLWRRNLDSFTFLALVAAQALKGFGGRPAVPPPQSRSVVHEISRKDDPPVGEPLP